MIDSLNCREVLRFGVVAGRVVLLAASSVIFAQDLPGLTEMRIAEQHATAAAEMRDLKEAKA